MGFTGCFYLFIKVINQQLNERIKELEELKNKLESYLKQKSELVIKLQNELDFITNTETNIAKVNRELKLKLDCEMISKTALINEWEIEKNELLNTIDNLYLTATNINITEKEISLIEEIKSNESLDIQSAVEFSLESPNLPQNNNSQITLLTKSIEDLYSENKILSSKFENSEKECSELKQLLQTSQETIENLQKPIESLLNISISNLNQELVGSKKPFSTPTSPKFNRIKDKKLSYVCEESINNKTLNGSESFINYQSSKKSSILSFHNFWSPVEALTHTMVNINHFFRLDHG